MAQKLKQEFYQNLGGQNTKVSAYQTGPTEFLTIKNFDFTTPGSLTKRPGSTLYSGATVTGRITGLYEFERLNGSSYLIATANTNAYTVTSSSFNSFKTGITSGNLFDFVTFVDRLFASNGAEFFKYDGTTVTNYSLPPGSTVGFAASLIGSGSGFTGIYVYHYGYLNDRGYVGPCSGGLTVSVAGHSAVVLGGFTTLSGYGITALPIYRTSANGVIDFRIGYASAGASLFIDTNLSLTSDQCSDTVWFTLAPRYLDIYNNQLFMAGFSSALSTVHFSQIGEPEGVEPDFNFEVRTNDGDRITGMKNYIGSLYIFKKNSFHRLSGDNPDGFLLTEISGEYGCLSNRAIAIYNDIMLFLDKKGVAKFDGAGVSIISDRIEPTFLAMNIVAAEENAVAIHNRLRNEIWFLVPCNGAERNNCVIIYDYLADAFAVWDVPEMSSLAMAKRGFTSDRAFFGSYSGGVFNFGSSLFGDFGQSITCILKTRFHSDTGKSIEQLYRRLYLDVDPVLGLTSAITTNFYTDYGSSIALTRTLYQAPFQSRIDFGLPAKSLSIEFVNSTSTDPIKVNGYTIESREQRRV